MASQYGVVPYADWKAQALRTFPSYADFSSLALSLFAHLDSLSIRTVVVESDYIDADFSVAYSHFYADFFHPPSKSCTRYLFFSNEFKTLCDWGQFDPAQSFLVFVTIWPTYPAVIGRSVLPFPMPSEGLNTIMVSTEYTVHVAGWDLPIRSAMFASKDHAVSACATVATWLATDLMHRQFDTRICSSTEITLLATGIDPKWGRPLPQVYGLDFEQITRALVSLDYGVHSYYFDAAIGPTTVNNWIGPLYGYISSGIPVIVLCDIVEKDSTNHHAVVAVGAQTSRSPVGGSRAGNAPSSFSPTVKNVLVHDDRWGLFGTLTPDSQGSLSCTINYPSKESKVAIVTALLVPLPRKVMLLSENAHALGKAFLAKVVGQKPGMDSYNGPFRTFLKRSTDLKKESRDWGVEVQDAAFQLRATPMSNWVWVTEAFPAGTPMPKDTKPLARVVFDSTQLKFAKDRLFLTGHFDNQVLRLDEAGLSSAGY